VSSIDGRAGEEIPLLGKAAPRVPAGIGGWLLIVAFGQIAAAIGLPIMLARQYLDPETFKYFGQIPLAMYGELVLNVILLLFALTVAVLFFRKSRHFPRLFIIQVITAIFFPIVNALWAALAFSIQLGKPFADLVDITPQDLGYLAPSTIAAGIWIAYILRSKRVRNTFILGLSARDMIVEADEGAQRLETPLLLVIGALVFMLGAGAIVLGIGLTIQRGVFNGSIVGGAVQVGLALWMLRGSDVARIILAFLFALAVVLWGLIAFAPGQSRIGTIGLLISALLCAGMFWVLVFSKRFRAELAINAAKYQKADATEEVSDR